MNPLFQMMNRAPANNPQALLSRFQQFRNSFSGNAQQQVQQLLNSGRVTQAQLNQAMQTAQQLQGLFANKF